MNVYQPVRVDATTQELNMMPNRHLLERGCNENIYLLQVRDQSVESVFGPSITPSYNINFSITILGEQATIIDEKPIEYNGGWMVLYKLKRSNG